MKIRIANLKKVNTLTLELKSEAVKPRHWKDIAKILKFTTNSMNDITLG
jgi:hypothetical protein